MATPHVSGVAALLLGHRPGLSALDLKQIIMDTVDPVASMAAITVTGGRLNAASALALTDPAPWMDLTPVAGVLWPGESVIISVTASAAGLAAGFFDSALTRVSSGDSTGPLHIPVSVTVGACTTDADCDDAVYCNGTETCGHRTAKTLRLNPDSLKKHVASGGPHDLPGQKTVRQKMARAKTARQVAAGQEAAMAFVELVPPEGACPPECVVELENPCGAKMRIRLSGHQSLEVVTAVSRVFFGVGS